MEKRENKATNQIDDDNNCEAVAKQTNNDNERDRNCVVEANTGEKEKVHTEDRGEKKVDNEFDIESLYNREYDYADIDGTVNGTDNGMKALEHVCDDDRKRDHNIEIRENNDNYNNDGGGGGGSVIGNNNANPVTIAMSALIDLSRGKKEENKSREETFDKIDDDGDLKSAPKSTDFFLRHDKDNVKNNDEGRKGEDK